MPDLEKRDVSICKLYVDKGLPLSELAAQFGLSVERVRQIVNKGAPGKMRPKYFYDRG